MTFFILKKETHILAAYFSSFQRWLANKPCLWSAGLVLFLFLCMNQNATHLLHDFQGKTERTWQLASCSRSPDC